MAFSRCTFRLGAGDRQVHTQESRGTNGGILRAQGPSHLDAKFKNDDYNHRRFQKSSSLSAPGE